MLLRIPLPALPLRLTSSGIVVPGVLRSYREEANFKHLIDVVFSSDTFAHDNAFNYKIDLRYDGLLDYQHGATFGPIFGTVVAEGKCYNRRRQ